MKRLWVLFGREFAAYVWSPVTWTVVTLVWLLYGLMVSKMILENSQGDALRMIWDSAMQALFLQILFVPLLTMRLLSDEKRTGTFEMLVTTPARDHEIVLAKFGAAAIIHAAIWLVIPVNAWVLKATGGDPDFGCVFAAYLGVIGPGTLFVALGLFASALTSHQIMAAFIAVILINAVLFLPSLGQSLPLHWTTLRAIFEGSNLMLQTEQSARGLIDLVHITFQVAFTALFLLFTIRALETRKWA